jgi:hypothetical protein
MSQGDVTPVSGPTERSWTLARVVGRDGRPRSEWTVGLPDEYPEHCSVDVVEVVPVAEVERLREALESIRARCDRIAHGQYGGMEAAREMAEEANRALNAS